MDFEFSPDQQQFINNVRAFLANEAQKPYAHEVMNPNVHHFPVNPNAHTLHNTSRINDH